MSRLASLREFFTRERGGPELFRRVTHNTHRAQTQRDVDAIFGWAARVVPLGIVLGLVLFAIGALIIQTLSAQ